MGQFYKFQHSGSLRKEEETNSFFSVSDIEALSAQIIYHDQLKVNRVEDASTSLSFAVLESALTDGPNTEEGVFITNEECSTEGVDFSIVPAFVYPNTTTGPTLVIDSNIKGASNEQNRDYPIPFKALGISLTEGGENVLISGLTNQSINEIVEDAEHGTPYVLRYNHEHSALYYWSSLEKIWLQRKIPRDTQTFLFSAKVIVGSKNSKHLESAINAVSSAKIRNAPEARFEIEVNIPANNILRFESTKTIKETMFIGQRNEDENVVLHDDSTIGVILQDVGENAFLIGKDGTQAMHVAIQPHHGKTRNVSITINHSSVGSVEISEPDSTESFPDLRLQTNQVYGFGFVQTENGKAPYVIQKTHNEAVTAVGYNINSQIWEQIAIDPYDVRIKGIQIVAASNTTMASEILEARWNALTEKQSELVGSASIYEIVTSIYEPKEPATNLKKLQEAANLYYRLLTSFPSGVDGRTRSLVVEKSEELKALTGIEGNPLNIRDVKEELASSENLFDSQAIQQIMLRLSQLSKDSLPQVEFVLKDLIPSLVAISDVNTSGKFPENNALAARTFLNKVLDSFEIGQLDVHTVLCPPYNYQVVGARLDKRASLKHLNGEILPTIGERYEQSTKVIAHLLNKIAKHLPEGSITYNVYTYSGEGGFGGMWEVGEDVLGHYSNIADGERQVSGNLEASYKALQEKTYRIFEEGSVKVQVASLESTLFKNLGSLYNDFMKRYGHIGKGKPNPQDTEAANTWLLNNLGVDMDWLEYFYREEKSYAQKQGVEQTYNVLGSAMREGLSYWAFQKLISEGPNSIMLGLETTSNYMVGSLPHFQKYNGPVGCIMARQFNPADPFGFGLRQPYNMPKYNIGLN